MQKDLCKSTHEHPVTGKQSNPLLPRCQWTVRDCTAGVMRLLQVKNTPQPLELETHPNSTHTRLIHLQKKGTSHRWFCPKVTHWPLPNKVELSVNSWRHKEAHANLSWAHDVKAGASFWQQPSRATKKWQQCSHVKVKEKRLWSRSGNGTHLVLQVYWLTGRSFSARFYLD